MRGELRGTPATRAVFLTRCLVFGVTAVALSACSEEGDFVDRVAADPAAASDALGSVAARAQLAIEPQEVELSEGESRQFSAVLVGPDGSRKAIAGPVEWSASAADGISVSPEGVVTAGTAGTYSVDARAGSMAASAAVRVIAAGVIPNPAVSVRANGQDLTSSIPAGSPIRIEWAAEDVASCRVLSNGAEIDRRASGQVTVVANQATNISVVCMTPDGDQVEDSVQVAVTRPGVSMAINDARADLTVTSGSLVNVAWDSSDAASCIVKSGSAVIGDTLSGSRVLTVTNGSSVLATCSDAAGNRTSEQHLINVTDSLRVSLAAGRNDQISGGTTARPLSIVFALDVTGSMASQIDTVKSGVQSFVSELVARNYAPLVGVIPFRDKVPVAGDNGDVPEGRIELTADAGSIKNFVGTLRAVGGGDANEAALGAIREGVAMLRTQDDRPDAVKLVIVVTDNPGHNGASSTDCALTPLVNSFAGLSATEQRQFKLFYSSPTSGQVCSGFKNAVDQMTALRSQILAAEPVEDKRGGLVPWPFAYSNLVTDVVNMIQTVTPPIEIACLNREVRLSVNGVSQKSWTVADLTPVFAAHESGAVHVLSQQMPEADVDAFLTAHAAGRTQVDATRCCVSKAAARAGNFSSCLRIETATALPFGLTTGG